MMVKWTWGRGDVEVGRWRYQDGGAKTEVRRRRCEGGDGGGDGEVEVEMEVVRWR